MIQELTAYWSEQAKDLALYFGVVSLVTNEQENAIAFNLGSFESFRVIQRSNYFLITYSDWEVGGFKLKSQDDRTSVSIVNAVERFCSSVIENLDFNKQAIKIIKAIQ